MSSHGAVGRRRKESSVDELVELVSIEVVNLEGKRWKLQDVPTSMLGRELYQMISERLPMRPGARLSIQNGSSTLSLRLTLKQQGIPAGSTTLSCVYLPVNLVAAWKYLLGENVDDEEFVLHGLTYIAGVGSVDKILDLPNSLQHLTLWRGFDESLARVNFSHGLMELNLGDSFNQSLNGVVLPKGLQNLSFGDSFNKRLDGVTLPQSLRSLTLGNGFNQSLDHVNLPECLQHLSFGMRFNKCCDGVKLPQSLRTLTFGNHFNQTLNLRLRDFAPKFAQLDSGKKLQQELGWRDFAELFAELDPGTCQSELKQPNFPGIFARLDCRG